MRVPIIAGIILSPTFLPDPWHIPRDPPVKSATHGKHTHTHTQKHTQNNVCSCRYLPTCRGGTVPHPSPSPPDIDCRTHVYVVFKSVAKRNALTTSVTVRTGGGHSSSWIVLAISLGRSLSVGTNPGHPWSVDVSGKSSRNLCWNLKKNSFFPIEVVRRSVPVDAKRKIIPSSFLSTMATIHAHYTLCYLLMRFLNYI